jgi:hypothetical protein
VPPVAPMAQQCEALVARKTQLVKRRPTPLVRRKRQRRETTLVLEATVWAMVGHNTRGLARRNLWLVLRMHPLALVRQLRLEVMPAWQIYWLP